MWIEYLYCVCNLEWPVTYWTGPTCLIPTALNFWSILIDFNHCFSQWWVETCLFFGRILGYEVQTIETSWSHLLSFSLSQIIEVCFSWRPFDAGKVWIWSLMMWFVCKCQDIFFVEVEISFTLLRIWCTWSLNLLTHSIHN